MKPEVATRGILNPQEGFRHFRLTRHAPSEALAPFIDWYWIVRWDLRDRDPFEQETLPYPCVNLVFEPRGSALHGPVTRRFVALLEGHGCAVAAKFHPGGFYPYFGESLAILQDRRMAIGKVFGENASAETERAVFAAGADADAVAPLDALLTSALPPRDGEAELATAVVRAAENERALVTVEALAAHAGLAPRSLQRLFRRYVGVGPKNVVRRFRIHEAAERVREGRRVDWAALAAELGYFDQAHFSRDFKSQVGRTPTDYALACEAASAAPVTSTSTSETRPRRGTRSELP